MKTLYILRHAKSDWNTPGLPDIDRPLNDRGLSAATKMGKWMVAHEISPDLIVSSPAIRAQQTIELACKEINYESQNIEWLKGMYLANLNMLVQTVSDYLKHHQSLLIVGHNPGLEELLIYLCGNDIPTSDSGNVMATATLAHIELGDNATDNFIEKGAGTLLGIHWPKQI